MCASRDFWIVFQAKENVCTKVCSQEEPCFSQGTERSLLWQEGRIQGLGKWREAWDSQDISKWQHPLDGLTYSSSRGHLAEDMDLGIFSIGVVIILFTNLKLLAYVRNTKMYYIFICIYI